MDIYHDNTGFKEACADLRQRRLSP